MPGDSTPPSVDIPSAIPSDIPSPAPLNAPMIAPADVSGVIDRLRTMTPVFWNNSSWRPASETANHLPLSLSDLNDAEARWERFAPVLVRLFPELERTGGVLDSALEPGGDLAAMLEHIDRVAIPGPLFVKADHDLPVAGSVKARGGIYAVLKSAEDAARSVGLLSGDAADMTVLTSPEARNIFGRREIVTGSTGNLGLALALAGRALGFRVTVHVSREARQWKKDRLRALGVTVMEHDRDYTSACRAARDAAANRPEAVFIDDENSTDLFLGYATAARRLQANLAAAGIVIGPDRPLILYLPCGVGGAAGGIAFGCRHVFGEHAHGVAMEPTGAPCLTLGLATGRHDGVSMADIGLSLATEADGLAVARASGLTRDLIAPLISACATVTDDRMFRDLALLQQSLGLAVEPSAAIGVAGPERVLSTTEGWGWVRQRGLGETIERAVHVVWTTGGALMPDSEYARHQVRGRDLLPAPGITKN